MAAIGELLKKPSFLIKFFEVILAIVCVALHQDSMYKTTDLATHTTVNVALLSDKNKIAFVDMVYCGFVLIAAMNIIGQLLGGIPKKFGMLWALVGCVLWVAAAAVILKAYDDAWSILSKIPKLPTEVEKLLHEDLAAGIVGVINGAVYLVEFLLIAKFESDE